MTDRDIELLKAVGKKDNQSFEALYKSYYKKLYVLAYRYLRSEEAAEEVVNDVFLKIWADAAQLTINQSLGSYLSRCVINAALNRIKKEKQEAVKQEQYTTGFEEIDDENDEAQLLEDKLMRLEKAISDLSPQCQKVLMMSKFDKCKQQEIADTLNISIKTVKSHLTYGYQRIRSIMGKEGLFIFIFILFQVSLRLIHCFAVL